MAVQSRSVIRAISEDGTSALAVLASLVMCAAAFLGPRLGDALSFRYSQVGLSVLLAVVWLIRPEVFQRPLWGWAWGVFCAGAWIWCVSTGLTHLWAFQINGVDFSIFEWMLGSTLRGTLGYTRIYDVNHFGVHSTFLMLALVPLYALWSSPHLLVVVGATLIWAGLFPIRALCRWAAGGPHGGLELSAGLAWLGNPALGRLLNAGFRIESWVPVLTLAFLVGWMTRRRWLWSAAAIGLLLSKEDSALFLAAFAVGAWVVERRRWREALPLVTVALAWLGVYVKVLQPLLLGGPPGYVGFWSDFGTTGGQVLLGMATRPLEVAQKLLTSRAWTVLLPALFIPLGSLRAFSGMAPTVFLLGTANYDQMRHFGTYYPAPLVAFVILAALEVFRRSKPGRGRQGWALASLWVAPLFLGGYAKAVPFDRERLDGMARVRLALQTAPRVCAQTVLFPHLGVDFRLIPLYAPDDCLGDKDAVTVVNPDLDSWPTPPAVFREAVRRRAMVQPSQSFPGGFLVFRAP